MKTGIGVAVLVVLASVPLHATAILTLGNNPQPGEENILFTTVQSGATVTGFTNISNSEVLFSSSTDTLMTTAVGQANIGADDGLINQLSVTVPLGTYTDLIMNPFNRGTISGAAPVTVITNDGTFDFPTSLGVGNNFMTVTTSGGEVILSTSITSAAGFADFRQPRISGASTEPGPVPEPGTLATMGIGVGVVTLVQLTRKRRRQV